MANSSCCLHDVHPTALPGGRDLEPFHLALEQLAVVLRGAGFLFCFFFVLFSFVFQFMMLGKQVQPNCFNLFFCFCQSVWTAASLARSPFCSAVNNRRSVTQGYTLMMVSIKARTFSYKASISKCSFQQFQLIPSSITQEAHKMNVSWRMKGNLFVKAMRLSNIM